MSTAASTTSPAAGTGVVTLDAYLAALYPAGTPGELLAYVKDPFLRRFGVAANLSAFARQIRAMDAKGFDCYLTINTLDGAAIRARGQYTRGTEAEVKAVVAIIADIDAAGKAGHCYPPRARILQTLADMPLHPSMVIVSGRADGGLHVYWLLAAPFIIRTAEDRARIKSISVRWQRLLKSKLAPFELDSTFDLVRVLRPIGTHNGKYGTVVSALSFHPERRYTPEDFERHLPAPLPPPVARPPIGTDANMVIHRAAKYVAAIPGAISGHGAQNATFHVACTLVLGFGLSPDDAFPILASWNETSQPPLSERELGHKLAGADGRPGERGYLLRDEQGCLRYEWERHAPRRPVINRLVLADSRQEQNA